MAEEGQLAGEVKVTKQYLVFHQCRIMEKLDLRNKEKLLIIVMVHIKLQKDT